MLSEVKKKNSDSFSWIDLQRHGMSRLLILLALQGNSFPEELLSQQCKTKFSLLNNNLKNPSALFWTPGVESPSVLVAALLVIFPAYFLSLLLAIMGAFKVPIPKCLTLWISKQGRLFLLKGTDYPIAHAVWQEFTDIKKTTQYFFPTTQPMYYNNNNIIGY